MPEKIGSIIKRVMEDAEKKYNKVKEKHNQDLENFLKKEKHENKR